MVAPCGFICSDCPAYEGNIKGFQDQEEAYRGWHEYWGIVTRPERVRCKGCLAPRPEGYVFPEIGCKIKPCVESKGLSSCGHCQELPCHIMEERFRDCEETHERWRGAISAADKKRFLDPYRPREVLSEIRSKGRKDKGS